MGGLELICGLLESSDDGVLAACCFAIANIARSVSIGHHIIRQYFCSKTINTQLYEPSKDFVKLYRDKENLAVITDHGVIEKLARLAETESDLLRAKLAEAIANCCDWAGNVVLPYPYEGGHNVIRKIKL